MRIWDAYLARAVWRGWMIALASMVILMSLIELISELKDIGDGNYGLVDALIYIILTMPERSVDVAPVSALIGAIVGLGALAQSQELIALRAMGVAPWRIIFSAGLAGIPQMAVVVLLLEFVVPTLSPSAENTRRVALVGPEAALTDQALWLRDGPTIARIETVRPGGRLEGVRVFRFDEARVLLDVLHADHATVESDGRWTLRSVRHDLLSLTPTSESRDVFVLDPGPGSNHLDLIIRPPAIHSLSDLGRRSRLAKEGEGASQIEYLFWRRLFTPLLVIAMTMMSVPFVLGRSIGDSTGRLMVVGIVLGVFAHIVIQAIAHIAILVDPGAILAGAAPVGLALCGSIAGLAIIR